MDYMDNQDYKLQWSGVKLLFNLGQIATIVKMNFVTINLINSCSKPFWEKIIFTIKKF